MRLYFILTGVIGVLVFLLMAPGILVIMTYATLGLAFAVAQLLVNLFALLLILLPAVILAQRTVIGGFILGAILVSLAVLGPAHMREKSKDTLTILQPPLAAVAGLPPKSIEFPVRYIRRDPLHPCSDYCFKILQNEKLDWVRLRASTGKTAMYVRGELGIMLPQMDNGLRADIIITNYDAGSAYPRPAMFSTWAILGGPKGYMIEDTRLGRMVARNIEATMKGVSDMATIFFNTDVNTGATSLSLLRTETAKVSADPNRNLEKDLNELGLIHMDESTNYTINSMPKLELGVQQILADNKLLVEKEQRTQDYKNVIDEFLIQIEEGAGVTDREEMLVSIAFDNRFETGKLIRRLQQTYPTFRVQLINRIVQKIEKGTKISRMLYFFASSDDLALEEIGRHQIEISNAFKNYAGARNEIMKYLPFLNMRNPELILDQIIEPFPSLDGLDKHLSVETRLAWQKNVPSLDILKGFWGFYDDGHTEHFVLFADKTLSYMGGIEGLKDDYVRDWVMRWSLGRPRPYMHPWEPVEEALSLLKNLDDPQSFIRLEHYFDKDW